MVDDLFLRKLKAYWVVLLCDDIMCVVVATVLTCGRSLATVMLFVLLRFTSSNIFAAAKETLDATIPILRIKVIF